jgi:predicted signal transduction protein with EAL and GGDEF domain
MSVAQSEGPGPLVLVVDDDEAARVLTEIVLTNAEFRVVQAENGKQALEVFRAERPDIVLLDVSMPVMDGFDACRALRQTPGGESVPVLMLTGHEDIGSINRAYEVGATDFLAKSSNLEIIAHRVRYMLRAARAFSELEKNREGLSSAQRMARMGGWEWRLDARRLFLSAEVCDMFGLNAHDFEADPGRFMNCVHGDDREGVREAMLAALRGIRPYDVHHRLTLPDGTERHVHAKAEVSFGADGRAQSMRGTIQDETERWLAEQKIHSLAYYDSLTGLPNRLMFRDQLDRAIARCVRDEQQLAVMFLDLDKFKRVNDTLGHSVGDQLLAAAAERIADCVRGTEMVSRDGVGLPAPQTPQGAQAGNSSHVGRLGGDEFTLYLVDVGEPQNAARVARRILAELARPFVLGQHEIVMSASIGIAVCPADGKDVELLLGNADVAMYHAKEQGRNNYQFYSRAMNAEAFQKLSLESNLRKALERGEFVLYYQPLVSVASGAVVGAEALIRWQHPDMGMVSPLEFIPLAEETGLIVPISEWVLDQACRQTAAWQHLGTQPVKVSVNLSGVNIRQDAMPQTVARALAASGLDPRCLKLELTESVLMRDVEATLVVLKKLNDMGVKLCIDDFGTGYSSFSYLRRFPLHTLKIDRSFVRDVPGHEDVAAITRAIIAMGHSLKLNVVAEGVETHPQLDYLRALGCDEYQGYLFSAAISAEQFEDLLRRGSENAASKPAQD